MVKEVRDGYIIDFISGQEVRASPEETDAVQVFTRQLVEDYGYPKTHIQTRPQFRVRARPSDAKKEYPVDIAVFRNAKKQEYDIYIIVECKKKTRKDGKTQLQDYLRFSQAFLGVWFNGEERLFLRKIEKNGKIEFEEIPNIPQYGQRVEDIGQFKRKYLKPTHNLKSAFKAIRNYLAANNVGATRDEVLAQQLINIIFCKIYDERFTAPDDVVTVRAGAGEDAGEVKSRILNLFDDVKKRYKEVFDKSDVISLDANSIVYVIGELQNYCLIEAERDIIADAFEIFIDHALKGGQGQFFTPRNVVRMMVEIMDPDEEDLIIDPACGSGGFLIESLRHIWKKLDAKGKKYRWNKADIQKAKMEFAFNNINGIDKDYFLSKVAKAYMVIIGDGQSGIFTEDSLEAPENWNKTTRQKIDLNKYSVLLTNPPFGKDIKIVGDDKLSQYELAYNWKNTNRQYEKTSKLKSEETPQIIFIERSLQFLRNGGKMGIVLPETFFHAPNSRYVIEYMRRNNNITWIIDIPHNTFRPHNNAKCVIIILEKNVCQNPVINMAVAEEMGHNHQGKEIYRWNYETKSINENDLWDDIPLILDEFRRHKFSKYCFKTNYGLCASNGVFVPRYYWENKTEQIEQIAQKDNLMLIPLKQLIEENIITFFDGHGSPPAEYKGLGEYPYIRVKDIVNWEIYKDPTAKIPENIYKLFKTDKKQLREKDIVYVRRGSYRIGSVAMVSSYDTDVILTREILVLRVADEKNKYNLTPFYLLYLLSHSLTGMQSFSKVLIETTLPNIAERWQEIKLPVSKNETERQRISNKIKAVIQNKWDAIKGIESLKEELGELTT
jgi:type I restriction enzyme M protein